MSFHFGADFFRHFYLIIWVDCENYWSLVVEEKDIGCNNIKMIKSVLKLDDQIIDELLTIISSPFLKLNLLAPPLIIF